MLSLREVSRQPDVMELMAQKMPECQAEAENTHLTALVYQESMNPSYIANGNQG